MSKEPESAKPESFENEELSLDDLSSITGGVSTSSGIQMTLEDDSSSSGQTTPKTKIGLTKGGIRTSSGIMMEIDDNS